MTPDRVEPVCLSCLKGVYTVRVEERIASEPIVAVLRSPTFGCTREEVERYTDPLSFGFTRVCMTRDMPPPSSDTR